MMHRVKKVVRHGYRKVRAINHIAQLEYERGDQIERWRLELSTLAGGGKDNHETYEIRGMDGSVTYVQFSDWTCYIGTSSEKWGY
jgi:hypothetical protein